MDKIIVKLNPEKGATFFQDPTDESNLIQNKEIKEFNPTPHVQQCLNAQGLIRLHRDDAEVKEYFAKVDAANSAKSEAVATSEANAADEKSSKAHLKKIKFLEQGAELLNDELTDAKAKIEELETANEGIEGLKSDLSATQGKIEELETAKKEVEDDLIVANNTIADKDAEIKKLTADLKKAQK